MGFIKTPHHKAYATAGIRTGLDPAALAAKLRSRRVDADAAGDRLRVRLDGHTWVFGGWQADGTGRIGWTGLEEMADAGGLSDRLAAAGVRHRIEYSRPRDLLTSDVRTVTAYEYRWQAPGLAPPGRAEITMYDEPV